MWNTVSASVYFKLLKVRKEAFASRKYIVMTVVLVVGFIYLTRLFYIQVIDNTYVLSARENVLRYVTQYPARGLIYDRNGVLLVYNEATYDLMVVPHQLKDFDTVEVGSYKFQFYQKEAKST